MVRAFFADWFADLSVPRSVQPGRHWILNRITRMTINEILKTEFWVLGFIVLRRGSFEDR
jgi:hypothetical protein